MKKINIVAFSICLTGLIIACFPRSSMAEIIYGCYDQEAGLLRVVLPAPDSNPADYCTCFEAPIQWNSGPDILADAKAYTDSLVASEATARAAGDATLSTALDNEISRAQSAERTISANLDREATARVGGDTAVLDAAKEYTDQQVATIPQGPPGVANGITTAVHGLWSYTDTVSTTYTGFSVSRFNPSTGVDYNLYDPDQVGKGNFRIWFNSSFNILPTCVVTLAFPNAGGQTCGVSVDYNGAFANVQCYRTSIAGSSLVYTSGDPNAFFFICVK